MWCSVMVEYLCSGVVETAPYIILHPEREALYSTAPPYILYILLLYHSFTSLLLIDRPRRPSLPLSSSTSLRYLASPLGFLFREGGVVG